MPTRSVGAQLHVQFMMAVNAECRASVGWMPCKSAHYRKSKCTFDSNLNVFQQSSEHSNGRAPNSAGMMEKIANNSNFHEPFIFAYSKAITLMIPSIGIINHSCGGGAKRLHFNTSGHPSDDDNVDSDFFGHHLQLHKCLAFSNVSHMLMCTCRIPMPSRLPSPNGPIRPEASSEQTHTLTLTHSRAHRIESHRNRKRKTEL